mgnify:CR=1 FL=1
MLVLGFDPGVTNFAYATYDGQVGEFGWLPAMRVMENDWVFLNAACDLIDRIKPDLVVIERFAYRKLANVESEHINHLIAKLDLIARLRGYETVLIMPAHWKVKLDTRSIKDAQALFPDIKFEAVHQADAAGQARYVFERRNDPNYDEELDEVVTTKKAKEKVKKAKAGAKDSAVVEASKRSDTYGEVTEDHWKAAEKLNQQLSE